MTLTDEELFECDKGLLAGVVPPTDADPSVAQERLLWLTRSMGTTVHDPISRVDWISSPYYFARTIVEPLDHVGRVRVAIACARAVLHLVPTKISWPRLAIEAAEAWCRTPTEEKRQAVRYVVNVYDAHRTDSRCSAAHAAAYAADTAVADTTYYVASAAANAHYADISLNIRAVVMRSAIEWEKLRT